MRINRLGYAYSFVNVDKYEMFVGAGLHQRNFSMRMVGTGLLSGESITFEDSSPLPLPTASAGMRFNVRDNLAVRFRFETFFTDVGNTKGRMQDSYLLLEYDITRNFGIGGGINAYNLDVENDRDNPWEVETSYVGFLLYLTASF